MIPTPQELKSRTPIHAMIAKVMRRDPQAGEYHLRFVAPDQEDLDDGLRRLRASGWDAEVTEEVVDEERVVNLRIEPARTPEAKTEPHQLRILRRSKTLDDAARRLMLSPKKLGAWMREHGHDEAVIGSELG